MYSVTLSPQQLGSPILGHTLGLQMFAFLCIISEALTLGVALHGNNPLTTLHSSFFFAKPVSITCFVLCLIRSQATWQNWSNWSLSPGSCLSSKGGANYFFKTKQNKTKQELICIHLPNSIVAPSHSVHELGKHCCLPVRCRALCLLLRIPSRVIHSPCIQGTLSQVR